MTAPRLSPLFVVVGFDLAWIASAYGGASGGAGWPGIVAVALYLAALVITGLVGGRDVSLLPAWALVGLAVEAAFVAGGFIAYPATGFALLDVPVWVIGLWVALGGAFLALWRPAVPSPGVLLAFSLAAPLAYLAGDHFGALVLQPLSAGSWLLLSLAYLFAVAGLTLLSTLVTPSSFSQRISST